MDMGLYSSPLSTLAIWAACAVIGYLFGSVNSSIIITRFFKGKEEDIRDHGSGNAGMTNVLRTVGKLPALLTFVGDFLKCVLAVLAAWGLLLFLGAQGETLLVGKWLAGVGCVFGHIFPVFYQFRGGKAVVTASALMLMVDWRVLLLILATFLIVFLMRRIVSLASISCAAAYPVYTAITGFAIDHRNGRYSLYYLIFTVLVTLLVGVAVLIKHKSNIERLAKGEEKPVGSAKRNGEK